MITMPRHPPSADTLDLFADLPEIARPEMRSATISVRSSSSPSAPARCPAVDPATLIELSDVELAAVLTNSARELQRRLSAAEAAPDADHLDLRRAADIAARVLADLAAAPWRNVADRTRTSTRRSAGLVDAKRSAVRAALRAGVKPGQVAKHFGLSLATVRQIAAQPR
jgi:hypothetical protein